MTADPLLEIQQLLRRYPADCQPERIEPLGSAGGMSGARFWRLATPRGELALRRWPREHPTSEHLTFIHAVLRAAAERGIDFLPVPLATRDGRSFVEQGGRLWELSRWLPGAADYEVTRRVEKLRAALRALARFHLVVADFAIATNNAPKGASAAAAAGVSPGVSRRLAQLQLLHCGGATVLADSVRDDAWPELAPLARHFMRALPAALPGAIARFAPLHDLRFALQPCLRDVWHDHVLFVGDEVSGLIDFGALDVETPAGDVARLLGSFASLIPPAQEEAEIWSAGLAAYEAERPLSQNERIAVAVFDISGTLLAGCNWIRWIYVERRDFDNRPQVVERFRRIVARCERLF